MPELTLAVEVAAPPDVVFEALVDWRSQGEWMLGTRVWPTHQDGRGVGGRICAFTGVGPVGFADPMEITLWEPPYRCHVRHLGRVVRGTGTFDIEPAGSGRSRFTWSEQLDLPGGAAGRAGFLAARPLIGAGLRLSLTRFARWAERGR